MTFILNLIFCKTIKYLICLVYIVGIITMQPKFLHIFGPQPLTAFVKLFPKSWSNSGGKILSQNTLKLKSKGEIKGRNPFISYK